jgi:hypothetical protein
MVFLTTSGKLAQMKTGYSNLREVGAFEAKKTLGTLLDRVERGEEM